MKIPREPNLSQKQFFRLSIISVLLVGIVGTLTFAANINIGSQGKTEFGQGILQAVACDTTISVNLTSKMDPSTGIYYVDTVSLSDLSTQLHDRTITVVLVGSDGSALNSTLSFDVASDGLTYTSTRAHLDYLDAFSVGAGPKAEKGSSKIIFTGMLTEEPTPIPANSVRRVALQTSGSGTCSVPSNIKAVQLYIDAPYVQGSYIPELYPSTSLLDTFNSGTTDNGNCSAITENTGSYSGDCQIILKTHANPYYYGGAITSSSTPTTGGGQTNQSPSAAVYTSNGLTVTFGTFKNYIGFWWSAGSTGNSVKFYRGSSLVATMTGDDVYNLIPKTSAQLTALDGTTKYTKSNYYGHPANITWDSGEPFVYFHAFAVNGFSFDKVVLTTTGNGFEYDNFTVANLGGTQLTPKNTLVFVNSYTYSG